MPAYRSTAEAEIRDAVVARIRKYRPGSRIIHEINAAGPGTNRIDVLAVGEAEIIAVEIKSAKDKIDRLPAQIVAMRGAAHHAVAALHEKFLVPATWSRTAECVEAPKEARGATVWAYPEAGADRGRTYDCSAWRFPQQYTERALPTEALKMLWRDELYALCGTLRIAVNSRSTMTEMERKLRWLCNGKELTAGICAMLRARRCIEADACIEPGIAA